MGKKRNGGSKEMKRREFLKAFALVPLEFALAGYPAAAFASGGRGKNPRLAVILDDFGNSSSSVRAAERLRDVEYVAAVLPGLKHTEAAIRELANSKAQIILHQPMEAKDMYKRGVAAGLEENLYRSGQFVPEEHTAVYKSISRTDAMKVTMQNMLSVEREIKKHNPSKGVSGLNNHQGSLATEDPDLMEAVAETVMFMQHYFNRRLFVVDSRTTPESRLYDAGKSLGIRSYKRDSWLDRRDTGKDPLETLERASRLSGRRTENSYVLIGHAHHKGTVDALLDFRASGSYRLL